MKAIWAQKVVWQVKKTRLWKICTKISVFCFKSFTKRRNCAKII